MRRRREIHPRVDWMLRCHLPQVIDIERESFPVPWTVQEFERALRQRNTIGMVCRDGSEKADRAKVFGYMIYELRLTDLEMVTLAVDPGYRRLGYGRLLLNKLETKLNPCRRTRLLTVVSEWNLDAQLFFRACGWKATRVERDHYDDGDGYRFEWSLPGVEAGLGGCDMQFGGEG